MPNTLPPYMLLSTNGWTLNQPPCTVTSSPIFSSTVAWESKSRLEFTSWPMTFLEKLISFIACMLNYRKQLLHIDKCFTSNLHDLVSVHFKNKCTKRLKQNIRYEPLPVRATFCDSPKVESFVPCPTIQQTVSCGSVLVNKCRHVQTSPFNMHNTTILTT